ncbi:MULTISPECIES: pseudouridine synthase [unclassified Carboxylicivirga]|uniref:RluA family pseudouridine synthase n=1 Tax=Carboxylicivirga TaxID=1628153 RepID=UPI003D33DFB7
MKQLEAQLPNPENMVKGKMFGILAVQTADGQYGFLTAYSGNSLDIESKLCFVPQVFDINHPNGFFKYEEEQLNRINREIEQLEKSDVLTCLRKQLSELKNKAEKALKQAKQNMEQGKVRRAKVRKHTRDNTVLESLIKESQTEKSRYNKLRKEYKQQLTILEDELHTHHQNIAALKQRRKQQSAKVQQQLFNSYIFSNARGEKKSAWEIFKQSGSQLPPAGTGDCAAPKLLHHAFKHNLRPVALAEFWWGPAPKTEIRQHKHFYPPCKSKCETLLGFMLQGLPLEQVPKPNRQSITLIDDDPYLAIISKPAGLLSVPGKTEEESVYKQVRCLFPDAEEPMIVHRLDMATSGLMLIAKTKAAHADLQKQFLNKTIEKQYVALLHGSLKARSGEINLPLRVDMNDRPRQLVCYTHGKPAHTKWKCIAQWQGISKVLFYPQTGRTHQLRVHAAHPDGLNAPIVGDPLYGKTHNRLMLHARQMRFRHPHTQVIKCYTLNEDEMPDWLEP